MEIGFCNKTDTMKKKISDRFIRDVRFYLRNRHRFEISGRVIPDIVYSRTSLNGLRAFMLYDSQGKLVPTKHPNILRTLITTKASVNLHIKMWKQGVTDLGFFTSEWHEYCDMLDAPDWFRYSFMKEYSNMERT